jgi:DNA-binding sugar fermentation-stimulating protein
LVSFIKIEGKTVNGVFKERLNLFLVLVKAGDENMQSFLSNSGRMHELLTPGAEVVLREVLSEKRKTSVKSKTQKHNPSTRFFSHTTFSIPLHLYYLRLQFL